MRPLTLVSEITISFFPFVLCFTSVALMVASYSIVLSSDDWLKFPTLTTVPKFALTVDPVMLRSIKLIKKR